MDLSPRTSHLLPSLNRKSLSAVGGRTTHYRVAVLIQQIDSLTVRQSAVQELALLASFDGAIRDEITLAKGDTSLVRTLKSPISDAQLLRWLLIALSHLACSERMRRRQNSAIPRMVELLRSEMPALAEASAQALLALLPSSLCADTIVQYGGPGAIDLARRIASSSALSSQLGFSPRKKLTPIRARSRDLMDDPEAEQSANAIQGWLRGRADRRRYLLAREFRNEQAEIALMRAYACRIQALARGVLTRVRVAKRFVQQQQRPTAEPQLLLAPEVDPGPPGLDPGPPGLDPGPPGLPTPLGAEVAPVEALEGAARAAVAVDSHFSRAIGALGSSGGAAAVHSAAAPAAADEATADAAAAAASPPLAATVAAPDATGDGQGDSGGAELAPADLGPSPALAADRQEEAAGLERETDAGGAQQPAPESSPSNQAVALILTSALRSFGRAVPGDDSHIGRALDALSASLAGSALAWEAAASVHVYRGRDTAFAAALDLLMSTDGGL